MKGIKLFILIIVICFLIGCGNNQKLNSTAQNQREIDDSNLTEQNVPEDTNQNVTEQKAPEITEVSDTEKSIIFYRNNMRVFGKMYLPEGEGPFPVVILQAGLRCPYTAITDIITELTKNGIVGVTFDCIGAVDSGKSDGTFKDMSVLTEAADLDTVLHAVTSMPKVDSENIFLWGHSFGGLVSSYAATKEPNLVKGLILVEPSYQFHDTMRDIYPEGVEIPEVTYTPMVGGKIFFEDMFSFNIYELMPEYSGEVLIIAGTDVNSIGGSAKEYLERAVNSFPSATISYTEGADHSFMGKYRQSMIDETIAFITSTE